MPFRSISNLDDKTTKYLVRALLTYFENGKMGARFDQQEPFASDIRAGRYSRDDLMNFLNSMRMLKLFVQIGDTRQRRYKTSKIGIKLLENGIYD